MSKINCTACKGEKVLVIGYADGTKESIECGFCSGEGSYDPEERAKQTAELRAVMNILGQNIMRCFEAFDEVDWS